MSLIQVLRRSVAKPKPYTHEFPDVKLEFVPNEAGDLVCDVKDEAVADRLLALTGAFAEYDPPKPAKKARAKPAAKTADSTDASKYVLVSGDQSLDLRTLDDAQLREFATANDIAVVADSAGDALRDVIVAALAKE